MNLFSHFIVLLALAVLAACEPADQASEADGQTGMQAAENQTDQSRARTPAASEPQVVRMEPVEGARTIGQLFEDREALEGETVVVKGQVVKFNQAIMDRNWVHLQDGTGDADAGTHDLTVTTDDMAREGDVVTVSGVVALDKDFGAGYTYDLLIEQASISPE